MSDLSAMAASFEKQSKEQAESIENSVKSALAAHENALNQCLRSEHKRIENATRKHARRMGWIVARTWLMSLVAVLILIAAAGGFMRWQATEIMQRRQTLSALADVGADMTTCGGRPCVQIDPDAKPYSNPKTGAEYRVLADN